MTTVTQWFGLNEKPVRKGAYESIAALSSGYADPTMDARWDGKLWRWKSGLECHYQRRTWRGLAEKPQP